MRISPTEMNGINPNEVVQGPEGALKADSAVEDSAKSGFEKVLNASGSPDSNDANGALGPILLKILELLQQLLTQLQGQSQGGSPMPQSSVASPSSGAPASGNGGVGQGGDSGPGQSVDLGLSKGPDGNLTEASKQKVNEHIAKLTDQTGREVAAQVYEAEDGRLMTQLTFGDHDSVRFNVPGNTIYSAHTHPNGPAHPSSTDLNNQLPGTEDVVVATDGRGGVASVREYG